MTSRLGEGGGALDQGDLPRLMLTPSPELWLGRCTYANNPKSIEEVKDATAFVLGHFLYKWPTGPLQT